MFPKTCGRAAAFPFLVGERQRHLPPRLRKLAGSLGGAKVGGEGGCRMCPMAESSANQGVGKGEHHPFCHLLHVFSEGISG